MINLGHALIFSSLLLCTNLQLFLSVNVKTRHHSGQAPHGGPEGEELEGVARILIVDDDEAGARGLAVILEELGYLVSIAIGWTDALRLFNGDDIDLVLMDAVMPTVDGFKLVGMLRARARSYVPIVFVTGLADASAREQGVRIGADDFLTKPVDRFELKVRLAAMLRIRRLTRALEARTRQLEQLAHFDALTGVANRHSFDERLQLELERARRYGHPLSVLILDLDHFKDVNDTYGHGVGDDILAFFGQLLLQTIRGCDLVYRYGGEEFVILVPETSGEGAWNLGERIRHACEVESETVTPAGRQTVSVGVCDSARIPEDGDAVSLLEAADSALYEAKRQGRNRVRLYGSSGEP